MENRTTSEVPIYSKSTKATVKWSESSRSSRPAERTYPPREDSVYHTYLELQGNSPVNPQQRNRQTRNKTMLRETVGSPGRSDQFASPKSCKTPPYGGHPTLLSQTVPTGRALSAFEPSPQRAGTPTRPMSDMEVTRPQPEGLDDVPRGEYTVYQGNRNTLHQPKDNSGFISDRDTDGVGTDLVYPDRDYPDYASRQTLNQTRNDPVYPPKDFLGATRKLKSVEDSNDPIYPQRDYPVYASRQTLNQTRNDPVYPPKDLLGATRNPKPDAASNDPIYPQKDYPVYSRGPNNNQEIGHTIYPPTDRRENDGAEIPDPTKIGPVYPDNDYPGIQNTLTIPNTYPWQLNPAFSARLDGPQYPRSHGPPSGHITSEAFTPPPFVRPPEDLPWRGQILHEENENRKRQKYLYKQRQGKGMDSCYKCLRWSTTIFTFIIFLVGAGILGLGIYILGSDYGAKQMSEILGNDLYQIAAYVLITSGSIVMLMSLCGCCGGVRESKIMLSVFILTLSLLMIALIVATVFVFVFRGKTEGEIIKSMEDVLIQKYGVDMDNSENRMISDMWNWLQRELKCCGVTGDINSTTSWAIYKHSVWNKGFNTGKPYVPQSCCKPDGDINSCTGIKPHNGPPALGPPLDSSMEANPNLYTAGCYDEVIQYIQNHAVIIGASAIASVVLMCVGIFLSVCMCRRIGERVEDEFY